MPLRFCIPKSQQRQSVKHSGLIITPVGPRVELLILCFLDIVRPQLLPDNRQHLLNPSSRCRIPAARLQKGLSRSRRAGLATPQRQRCGGLSAQAAPSAAVCSASPRPNHRSRCWLAAVAFLFARRYPPQLQRPGHAEAWKSVVVESLESTAHRLPSYMRQHATITNRV